MKILMINGSPHPRGCTYTALHEMERVLRAESCGITNASRYRTRTIPAAGALLREEERGERQMTLLDGAEDNTK